jgi:hypothetical protein
MRPLAGHDELALDPTDPDAGNRLLDRLLVNVDGGIGGMALSDRDRLYAALYRDCFGDDVDCVATCASCGEAYELGFALSALADHQTSKQLDDLEGPDDEGFYRTSAGARIRRPTVTDLAAVNGQRPEDAIAALITRCVDPHSADVELDVIEHCLERIAPILDIDVAAHCPHCAAPQSVPFSLESQLIHGLAQERRFLTQEVHRLALAYGWGLGDILSLSRADRRTLVRQIEFERAGRMRR